MTATRNSNDAVIERTLAVEQKLYYDVHIPADDARPRPLLLALHGYGGSKRQMMREARQLAPDDFVIAAVQGVHQHIREPREAGAGLRYGFGWLTNFRPEESITLHHQALIDIIETLSGENIIDRTRVFLLGFSQSVALNYRFAFTHTKVLRGVVGICGGLPGDLEPNDSYATTGAGVFHLSGDGDEFYPPALTANYEDKLRARASQVETRRYADAAHVITDEMRADVRLWLAARANLAQD